MTIHNQNKMFDSPIEVVKPFASYLAMFVGMGLISGSIVHAGQAELFKQAVFLIFVGMIFFAVGSYVNEVIFKTGNIEKEGIARYIVLSLFLAMGVGMISGSTQHFFDTPIYASYLMPGGIFIASLAFALRNNYELSTKTWGKLLAAGMIFAAVLFFGLNTYAKTLPIAEGHGHGSEETTLPDATHTDTEPHAGSKPHSKVEQGQKQTN
jgi:hypothetical protein